ncbi:MAG TPA: PPOX class F420-dependent oxidoreductase [Solirubrobacteraceae bacterium]|jgi:PPOX class probable F420-dependent enzyme
MTNLQDQPVQELLERPNHAIVSTFNKDGSILSTVAWVNTEGDALAVNSAVGRRWPANLQRDPRVTLLIPEEGNPYNYVEVRGTATVTREGADDHINALAKKYINQDEYPFRQPGEERIKFVIAPEHVRHQKQG